MKNLLFTFFILLSFAQSAQTHVGGGIYANTTWLKSNSPYIVDTLLVIFPGVQLNVQAGVTVKFKQGVMMEVRQATLNLLGTANDSITFTSNASIPVAGDWDGVYLNGGTLGTLTQYFNMSYALNGINKVYTNTVTGIYVKNSCFLNNTFALKFSVSDIESSVFMNNGTAIGDPSYVGNCIFNNNGAGITNAKGLTERCSFLNNQVGISGAAGTIKKCEFVNNSQSGISGLSAGATTPLVDSCVFKKNNSAMWHAQYATISNSIIDSNNIGINIKGTNHIVKNNISYNQIGIEEDMVDYINMPPAYHSPNTISENSINSNTVGIQIGVYNDVIACNTICNNSFYNLKYTGSNNTALPYASKNNWCSTDSATIAATIYDGYDNTTLGLVSFTPLDLASCYLTSGISENSFWESTAVYPNPSTGRFSINYPVEFRGTFRVVDLRGSAVFNGSLDGSGHHSFYLDAAPGIYICELKDETNLFRQKIVLRD